jgi:ComF family protein
MLSACFDFIENWLFETECLLCKSSIQHKKNICSPCISELPWNNVACWKCATPLHPLEINQITCGSCLRRPPLFHKAHATFIYQPPITQMIGQLKFNQNLIFGSVLSELLLISLLKSHSDSEWPQVIIPVPLHVKRLAERGYNQAIELAKPLGKALGIPVDFDLCERVKKTTTQTTASARERRENLRNAFSVTKKHELRHVAIVDDVLTTGSTAIALSKSLKKSGVEKIDVWAIAKTSSFYSI